MRFLITGIKGVGNILKTGTKFGLFAALIMFSSIAWAQENATGWTPPQTIVTSVPESGFDWDEVLVDIATDLSGHWHLIYSYVDRVEVYPIVCSTWTYIKYTNYTGVTETVAEGFSWSDWVKNNDGGMHNGLTETEAEGFSSSEGGHVYGPSITVDHTDTIHVTYIYCDPAEDECSIKYTKRAVTGGKR